MLRRLRVVALSLAIIFMASSIVGLSYGYPRMNAPSEQKIVPVAIIQGGWWTDDLYNFLSQYPQLSVSLISSYTPDSLATYAVVIIYGNMYQMTGAYIDAYVEGGGGLIATPWAASNWWEDYIPSSLPVSSTLNNEDDIYGGHQIDMTAWNGRRWVEDWTTGYERYDSIKPGAFLVAKWTDGTGVAVAAWTYGAGKAVYINMHYITSDCERAVGSTAGNWLMLMAIRWIVTDPLSITELTIPPQTPNPTGVLASTVPPPGKSGKSHP